MRDRIENAAKIDSAVKGAAGFRDDENGGVTSLSLLLLTGALMVGAYAIDWSALMSDRTHQQVAVDSAAHAALLSRDFGTEAEAVAAGIAVANHNMPTGRYGTTVTDLDVTFGVWDGDTWTFTPSPGSREAVRVRSHRNRDRGNALGTYLFRIVGVDSFDLTREAIFETYKPTCLREGIVAEEMVDIQSNNSFSDGFCVHSNDHVSINSNNYFEPGTVVSMPDEDDIDLPNSGFATNDGLQDALRSGSWHIRILNQLPGIIDGLRHADSRYLPDYITSPVPVVLSNRNITEDDLIPGRIHTYSCSGGAALTFKNGITASEIVLVTDNCPISFEQGVRLEDAVVATMNPGAKSITSAAGLRVGRDDNCAPGGGAQLLTLGGMDFPSDLHVFGGQLIALGDINFAANADGVHGASFVAGGEISGTSNMKMGFCGDGMDGNFQAVYFRLVQ